MMKGKPLYKFVLGNKDKDTYVRVVENHPMSVSWDRKQSTTC
jgi:hypothetical protein